MKIREANMRDIEPWTQMRASLWPDSKDDHMGEIQAYFDGESVDIVQTFIAEFDRKIVGFIELNIRNFAEGSRSARVPYVEAWYIKPDYQSNGYGSKLERVDLCGTNFVRLFVSK